MCDTGRMTDTTNASDAPVRCSRVESTGLIELTRPRALNSLNLGMVREITAALDAWRDDDAVDQVLVVSASPKAFCAGGDVRAAREGVLAGRDGEVEAFFAEEYAMNLAISEYPKPYVALLDGVTMGGGLGVSAHGAHVLATDRASASMPEMAIGFCTDVGMSRRFQQLRGGRAMGAFLALTGFRLNAAEMAWTGLSTASLGDADADEVRQAVIAEGAAAAVGRLAAEPAGENRLVGLADQIGDAFAAETWPEVLERLERPANAELGELVAELTAQASPSSLVATTLLFTVNAEAGLADALERERRLAAVLRARPDFAEGVRAVLVDKDRGPAFNPAEVAEVDAADFAAALS